MFAGYPEELSSDELIDNIPENKDSTPSNVEKVGANSAVLYGLNGEWISGYRKTHLFKTDKTWAKAGQQSFNFIPYLEPYNSHVQGTGFTTFTLPPPIGTVCLGICMDLNPQIDDWMQSEEPYELASHCLSNNADVLILLNSWLDSGEDCEDAYDWSTLNYWAARLQPLWTDNAENDNSDHDLESDGPSSSPAKVNGVDDLESKGKETIVIICNRCGEENGKSSDFLRIRSPDPHMQE